MRQSAVELDSVTCGVHQAERALRVMAEMRCHERSTLDGIAHTSLLDDEDTARE